MTQAFIKINKTNINTQVVIIINKLLLLFYPLWQELFGSLTLQPMSQ